MSAEAIRLVVAGSGAMARYHLTRFSSIPGVSFVGCYDRYRKHAEALAREYSLPASDDEIGKLLDRCKPDGITIAVADSQHHEIASVAIRRGIPVFLEKPFTVDVVQAEHIVELQRRYRVPVMVNFSKLNYPAIWAIVQAATSGRLGALKELEFHYLQSWIISTVWGEWWRNPRWLWRISSSHGGGGALRDLGSHLVYLAIRIDGGIRSVRIDTEQRADRDLAAGSGYSCDMNDTFVMNLEFESGCRGTIRGSFAEPDCINRVYARVAGTEGTCIVAAEKDKDHMYLYRDTRAHSDPRVVRFKKVYSSYSSFITNLRARCGWESYEPSADSALAVQQLLSGITPSEGRHAVWVCE